ncbi:TetR/AcrR family transcriptional regulator [Mucilaginibacter sp. Mucisp84]|uniref:TetR/AcrR family transcriptional regulator n=1 Tax=Mucilaginibacter sp. Mucisp84 TaxID=3243058 RepID=UPI0039A4EEC9
MTKKSAVANTGQILERSFDILHKEGWEGFSMRKLAGTMNCSAAIIYIYFPSKEKLLASVVRIGVFKLVACLKAVKGRHAHANGIIETMWLAYYDFAVSYQTFYQLMLA